MTIMAGVGLDRVEIEGLEKRLTKLISRYQGLGSSNAEQPRCQDPPCTLEHRKTHFEVQRIFLCGYVAA